MPRKIISDTLKKTIIIKYQEKPITIVELSKIYHLSCPTIGQILKDVPRWSRNQLKNPNIQENWFKEIDNQNKAYYLGLFITDGNICLSGKNPICSITLSEKDDYLLQKWFNLVGMNKKLTHDGRGCSQAAIISHKMAEDLSQYGVIPKKTFHTYLPNLNDEYMPHLIRGIIDGDGHIEAKWHKSSDGRNRFLHRLSICGTHQLLEDINNYLDEKLQLKYKPKIYDYSNKSLSDVGYSNYEDIIKIGNWIYNNAETYMIRKKEKYDLIFQRNEELKTVC